MRLQRVSEFLTESPIKTGNYWYINDNLEYLKPSDTHTQYAARAIVANKIPGNVDNAKEVISDDVSEDDHVIYQAVRSGWVRVSIGYMGNSINLEFQSRYKKTVTELLQKLEKAGQFEVMKIVTVDIWSGSKLRSRQQIFDLNRNPEKFISFMYD